MRYGYSRLASSEEKRNIRRAVIFGALAIGALVLLFTSGIPLIAKFAAFMGDLKKSSSPVDQNDRTPPPPPTISDLPDYTKDQKLIIDGSTEAGATVKLFFNNSQQEVVAGDDGAFTFSVMLAKGENKIALSAKDASGNESQKTPSQTVTYKSEPPSLDISSPNDGSQFFGSKQRQVTLQGKTDAGVTLTINDRPIRVNEDGSYSYTTTLSEGNNDFYIKAIDAAGNSTEKKISLNYSS